MKRIAYEQMFKNELTHAWYKGTRELMVKLIESYLKEDPKILDVGCGTGGTIKYLIDHGYKNLWGIEKSPYAISFCRERKIKNVIKASINDIPFKTATFDVVICLDVLYHKGVNPQKSLSEIHRILKPGGILYIQEPAYNFLKSAHDKVIETERRFTAKALKNLLLSQKFKIIKITHFNIFLLPMIMLKRIKDKIFQRSNYQSDVEKLPEFTNKAMFKILKLESQIIEFFNLPVGLSVICVLKK